MQSFGRKPKNNLEFLDAIFLGDFSRVWVGDYTRMGGGFATPAYVAGLNPDVSNYFAAATLNEGASSRTNTNFLAGRVIVLDDVGTKIGLDFCLDFALPPTYRIETSPGNEQWGYVLEGDGETDAARWHAFIELWKASPVWKSSSDGTGLAPYKRLPFGKAHKDTCRGFETRLVDWNPGARYTLDDLASMMFLSSALDDPDVLAGIKKPSMHAGLKKIDDPEVLAKDPIYRLFQHLGRVQSHAKDDGWIDVRCLWEDEHTGGAHGAAGGCAWHPKGLYRCHHSHCADRNAGTVNNLLFNYDEQDDPDAKRIFREMVFPPLFDASSADAEVAFEKHVENFYPKETRNRLAETILLMQIQKYLPDYAVYYQRPDDFALKTFLVQKPVDPPVRPKIFGRFHRNDMTAIAAVPSIGKSLYALHLALSVAWETLLPLVNDADARGINPDWCGDVVIVANEDSEGEVEMRLRAAMKHHSLDPSKQKHDIHIVSRGRVKIMKKDEKTGKIVPDCVSFLQSIVSVLESPKKPQIAMVILDTLSSSLEGIDDSSQKEMQPVMDFGSDLASALFASLVVVHHTPKAGAKEEAPTAYSALRGSTVIAASIRFGIALSHFSDTDKKTFRMSQDDAANCIRVDAIKGNYEPGTGQALAYYKKVSLDMPAFDPRTMSRKTERVGVLEEIFPPSPLKTARMDFDLLKTAIDVLPGGQHIKMRNSTRIDGRELRDVFGVKTHAAAAERLQPLIDAGVVETRDILVNRNRVEIVEIVDPAAGVVDTGDCGRDEVF